MVIVVEPEMNEPKDTGAWSGIVVSNVRVEEVSVFWWSIEEILSVVEVVRAESEIVVQFALQ
jgi:hypothetical protein